MERTKKRVLFLCTGNSCRSQMAESWLRHLAGDRFEAISAGTDPQGIHPLTVESMRERGIEVPGQRSKSVENFSGQSFDFVITVCDKAPGLLNGETTSEAHYSLLPLPLIEQSQSGWQRSLAFQVGSARIQPFPEDPMDCIFFRHGIAAAWEDWAGHDSQRPLTPEGIEKTRQAARGLIKLEVQPTHLLYSPFVRTQETADIVKKIVKFDGDPDSCPALLSDAPPERLFQVLAEFPHNSFVLCVGHEPHLGLTAGVMVFGKPSPGLSLKKAGACCIRFESPPQPGRGILVWWMTPSQLRGYGKSS